MTTSSRGCGVENDLYALDLGPMGARYQCVLANVMTREITSVTRKITSVTHEITLVTQGNHFGDSRNHFGD